MFSPKRAAARIISKPMRADDVIHALRLEPHPEGGHYRENFRDPRVVQDRAASTAIYYLLKAGERSNWHKVDAAEIWHYYAGAPLKLFTSADGKEARVHRLGLDMAEGEEPQVVVPAFAWQSAETTGDWTLVGCTVAPGFEFSGFELAPAGWMPG